MCSRGDLQGKVLSFLTLTNGSWDPSLAFVMGAALVPSFISNRMVKRLVDSKGYAATAFICCAVCFTIDLFHRRCFSIKHPASIVLKIKNTVLIMLFGLWFFSFFFFLIGGLHCFFVRHLLLKFFPGGVH
jgi:hypothetical protein